MFKLKRHLVPFSVIISLLATLCFVFAQESLTITTYYPSPYGSYQDLETGNLTFRENAKGLIHFNYPDTTYDQKLRITAGKEDTIDNTQGASIDLHGVNATGSGYDPGRLDLMAGQGGTLTFLTSPAGSPGLERMSITPTGILSLDGDYPRYFWMERHATIDTAGNSLTIRAGGASSGATNRNGGELVLASGIATGTGLSYITFQTATAGTAGSGDRSPTTKMTILGNGNVGIGTTAPGGYLDVNPTYTGATVANIFNQRNGFTLNNAGITVTNWYGSYIAAPTVTAGTLTNRYALVTEANAGNVGIGTTSPDPANRLQVNGVIQARTATNARGFDHNAGDGTYGLITWLGTDIVSGAWFGTTTSHPLFLFTNNSQPQITLTTAGNVGIGTTSPDVKLDVDGDIEGDLLSTGNTGYVGYVAGGANGGIYKLVRYSSSRRYKENITDFNLGLDVVKKLRPVKFNWKSTGDRDFGFIAEDAEEVNPLLVTKINGEVEAFKYMPYTAILTNAIKEQQKEIDELKEKVKLLEAKLKL